jgi:hypothetical protein
MAMKCSNAMPYSLLFLFSVRIPRRKLATPTSNK